MSMNRQRLGKYEFQELLGSGGMAEVWKALDTQLQRHVAIKILRADLQADPDFINRFTREARVLASLRHPNIVQIHDFQIAQSPQSNSPLAYMVMEYIDGQTLADYIHSMSRAGTFPSANDVVHLFASISNAIDYAHQHHVVHRDIKPANILLDKRSLAAKSGSSWQNSIGEPVLTDFGIAKLLGPSTGSISGSWPGTPMYAAPEQALGYPGNERSDIYSLGVILYELSTGSLPFGNGASTGTAQDINTIHISPTSNNPSIPPALIAIIQRCLAADPAARFPSASSLTAALAEAFNLPVPETLDFATYSANATNESTPHQPYSSSRVVPPTPALPATAPATASLTVVHGSIGPETPTTPLNRTTGQEISLNTVPDAATTTIEYTSAETTFRLPLPQPAVPQPERRKGLLLALIPLLTVIFIGSGLGTFLLISQQRAALPASPAGGYAFFLSSGQFNEGSTQGINDILQVNLHNIPDPATGNRYYVWLLNDESKITLASNGTACKRVPLPAASLLLGSLPLKRGTADFTYASPQHANLLENYSRLLITEENAQHTPRFPSSDKRSWRYFDEIPQTADRLGKCFSVLDYIRHLLSDGLQIESLGIRGGLDVRFFKNVQKVLEFAGSARDAWGQDPTFIKRQAVRILAYLDGTAHVQQDLPPRTSVLLDDPLFARFGLGDFVVKGSYMDRIGAKLRNMSQAPGVTPTIQKSAITTNKLLPNIRNWLKQVHDDARLLVYMTPQQLQQPLALIILNDMQTQASFAFVGHTDPSTNTLQAGVVQVHDNIQQLATFYIQPYTP